MPPVESFDEILATLPDRRSRSRLEPYGELIHKLLRRGRTYREVAAILIDRCHVHASISTIHDFVRRRAAAGPRRTGTAGSQRAAGNQAIQKRDNVENSGISEEIQRRIAAAKLRQTTPRIEPPCFHYDPKEPLRIPGKPVGKPPGTAGGE